MKIFSALELPAEADASSALVLANDADPLAQTLAGVTRIDLQFPAFTDGRAYSQAYLLRRRAGFAGEIRATGDVLLDQLAQLRRCGFDAAVLRADQDPSLAARPLAAIGEHYQGDIAQPLPHFARAPRALSNTDFASKLEHTKGVLRSAATQFAPDTSSGVPRLTLACSLGAEDMVLLHLVHTLALPLDAFVLDTGHLHAETLELLARVQQTFSVPIRVFHPHEPALQEFVQRHGANAMRQSVELRHACCHLRKLEPLGRALSGRGAWITGLRREQSSERAQVPEVDHSDPAHVKFNPLAAWSWSDVWHYIKQHQVPYHPLHDAFYPSIGCAPCTRAITPGEDPRAGRWWWEHEAAKECGLHTHSKE